MKLGKLGIHWMPYIPKWQGNRQLPKADQLSLEIRLLRPIDTMVDPDPEEAIKAWAVGHLGSDQIKGLSVGFLRVLKQLTEQTRHWKNFEFEDENGHYQAIDDGAQILLHVPNPAGERQQGGLIAELLHVIGDTAHLTAEQLKNYDGPPVGEGLDSLANSASTVDGPNDATIPPAPVGSAN